MNTYTKFAVLESISTLQPDQVREYVAAAKRHYTSDLPYHNWEHHAQAVILGTEVIATKLEQKGIVSARGMLAIAAAWHDAGYHENHVELGFRSKEAYSRALLEEYLEKRPVTYFEKELMLRAILDTEATHHGARLPMSLILHRADIANIGGPTTEFIANSRRLWEERRLTTGVAISWENFVAQSAYFIEFTAAEHDYESLSHHIATDDTTLDVHNAPFRTAALENLETIQKLHFIR